MTFEQMQIRFYNSKEWKQLRFNLIIERGPVCNRCGKVIDDLSKLIGHHTIELNETNIINPNVSLNPINVELICLDCHNKEHRRFGGTKKVYIVYGSPLSGKNTLVIQLSRYGDMILDVDNIWQCITGQERYIKPNNLRFNVFQLRDSILDMIKMRYGEWYDCYVIGGYPDKYERERLSNRLNAELIYVESTKDECLKRASERPSEWAVYVDDWWERYTPR